MAKLTTKNQIENDLILSCRPYYASLAMQGFLASPNYKPLGMLSGKEEVDGHEFSKMIAQVSVQMADALIAELLKKEDKL